MFCRWLSRDEDDGEICREIPASIGDKPMLPGKFFLLYFKLLINSLNQVRFNAKFRKTYVGFMQCNEYNILGSSKGVDHKICCYIFKVLSSITGLFFTLVTTYDISVYTGNLWNAGTTASIYLTLFGELGDSGPRLLQHGGNSDAQMKGGVSSVLLPVF